MDRNSKLMQSKLYASDLKHIEKNLDKFIEARHENLENKHLNTNKKDD